MASLKMGTKMPRYTARQKIDDMCAGVAGLRDELRGALGPALFDAAEFGAQQFDDFFEGLVDAEFFADGGLQRPVDTCAFTNQIADFAEDQIPPTRRDSVQ
jgi:hypothetical protein